MKSPILIILLLFPLLSSAQDMMQKLQQMQECMQGIDQAELKAIEQQSLEFQQTVKSLCASGQTEQAQQQAIAFGREVVESKPLAQIRECAKIMEGVMPELPYADIERDYANINVCETF